MPHCGILAIPALYERSRCAIIYSRLHMQSLQQLPSDHVSDAISSCNALGNQSHAATGNSTVAATGKVLPLILKQHYRQNL